ncbi:MAG: hypothetical protein U1F49_02600 [Rubrivivax sp.]
MIEQVLLPLALWVLLMALASAAELALVGAWPWAARSRRAEVAFAAGLGAAPLLAGLAAVFALWALPDGKARLQAALAFGVLAVVAIAGLATGAQRGGPSMPAARSSHGVAAVLACAFFAALLLDVATVPLIQNDARSSTPPSAASSPTRATSPATWRARTAASLRLLRAVDAPAAVRGAGGARLRAAGHERIDTLLMRLVAP